MHKNYIFIFYAIYIYFMTNYKDYYYKYKALKYYLKNNSIENQKQIKGGTETEYDYAREIDNLRGEIDNLRFQINLLFLRSNKNNFYTILHKLEGKVLYKNDHITLLYTDFYEYLYSLLNSNELLLGLGAHQYKKEKPNLSKILEILSTFLHHNRIIEDTNYNDFEIIKDDKDTENYLLKIKGNGKFG